MTSQIVLGNLQITFHPLLGTLQFLPIVCRVQRLLWTLPYIDYCGQGIIIFLLHLTLMYTGIVLASQQTNQFTRNDFEKLPLASGWCYHINKRGTGVQLSFPVRLKHRVYYKKRFLIGSSGSVEEKTLPTERLILISALDVFKVYHDIFYEHVVLSFIF